MRRGGTLLLSRRRAAHNLHPMAWSRARDAQGRSGMPQPETIADLLAAHRTGGIAPVDTVTRCYARIRAHADPAIFITLRDERDALAEAQETAVRGRDLPLYGIP